MKNQSHYISIFDKSPVPPFGLAHNVEHLNTGYLAVSNASYEEFERSCRALGRPSLVVINESLIHAAQELSYVKSLLTNSGIRWLSTECEELSHSSICSDTSKHPRSKHWDLPFEDFLRASIPVSPHQSDNTENHLCGYGIRVGDMGVQTKHVGLTPRQEEVYNLVLRGLSNKRIARTLAISESTVKEHITGILQRLGLKTRVEALSRALVPQH